MRFAKKKRVRTAMSLMKSLNNGTLGTDAEGFMRYKYHDVRQT